MPDIKNSALSGVISGSLTAIIFQPFEYVKTKQQQPDSELVKSELSHGIKRQVKLRQIIEKTLIDSQNQNKYNLLNLSKFWTGLTPSLLRSIPVAAIYFGCIDVFKHSDVLGDKNKSSLLYQYPLVRSFFIGALAKTISDAATFPLNLIKTRYESDFYNYKSMFGAFKSIVKDDGFKGLYRGLVATLIRDVGYSGVYFVLYKKIKMSLNDSSQTKNKTSAAYFATCAMGASVFSCLITQPPDVIRSYIQLKPDEYKNFYDTAKSIYAQKGIRGFLVGFVPRSTRRVLISIITWTLYEKLTLKK